MRSSPGFLKEEFCYEKVIFTTGKFFKEIDDNTAKIILKRQFQREAEPEEQEEERMDKGKK